LERLNSLQREEAEAEFLKCCGSTLWARRMAEERPFHDLQQLLAQGDAEWWALDPEDWLEAFSRHPKIGERAAARSWSEQEQAGAKSADDETRQQLAAANREYESRFGHIYIVCATGKTADEMLSLCRERLSNDPDAELRVAAEEQRRITHLRLRKLLGEESAVRRQESE
jgi:OHCU decarboxylase